MALAPWSPPTRDGQTRSRPEHITIPPTEGRRPMNTQVHRTFDQHLHFGILVKIALKNPPTIPYTLELRQGDVPKGLPERQRTLPCKSEREIFKNESNESINLNDLLYLQSPLCNQGANNIMCKCRAAG